MMGKIDDVDLLDSFNDNQEFFSWYSLRVLSVNEDKVVSVIQENIKHYMLEDKVKDVQVLKEYRIDESKEYLPNSPDLPLRSMKGSKTSVWVKTSYGKIKKIKLTEVRPFKGIVFIKAIFNDDLFKTIKTWDPSIYFLGDPIPQAIGENSFQKMKDSLSQIVPSLEEYIVEKNYTKIEGTLRNLTNIKIIPKPEDIVEKQSDFVDKTTLSKNEKNVDAITSNINNISVDEFSDNRKKFNNIKDLKVNDVVFVNDFGSQGSITDINFETGEIVVSVQAFGRRQPIVCQISQISEI